MIFKKTGFVSALSLFLTQLLLNVPSGPLYAQEIPKSPVETAKSSESTNKASDLARKVLAANGGLDAIKKFNHSPYRVNGSIRHFSSISNSENNFEFQSEVLQNKQRISMEFMGQELVTGFDGKVCWSKQDNTVLPADPLASERIKEEIEHGMLLLEKLLDPGRDLKLFESVDWKGKKSDVLAVKADDGKETKFYIDPKTFLVLRSEFEGSDQEQGTPCLKGYEYFNYKTVSGTKQPARVIEYSDLKKVSDVLIKGFNTSISLPANYFNMPVGAKIARLEKGPVEVPFYYSNNQVLVKVKINGMKDLLFLLDTGATQTILDSQHARELNLANSINASKNLSITTGAGSMKMHSVRLDSLELGEIKLEDVSIASAKLQSLSTMSQMEPAGLLGANILKRFLVTIDYDRQVVRFSDPDNVTIPENAIILETKPSLGMGGLAVEGSIDDGPSLNFLIDTGAAFNHVSRPLINEVLRDKEKSKLLPVGSIKGLDDTPVSTGAIIFDKLKIGKYEFRKPVFSVSAQDSANNQGLISGGRLAILGNPFFSRFRFSVDYRNQRLFLEKTPEKALEDSLLEKIDQVVADYRRNNDGPAARDILQKLQKSAADQKQTAASSLALAYDALILGYENREKTITRAAPPKDAKATDLIPDKSITLFSQAYGQSMRSNSKKTAAIVLSVWSEHLLENFSPGYSIHARNLVGEGLRLSPSSAFPMATLGLFLLRQYESGEKKPILLAQSLEVVNQALMLDPSNWIALKTKLELARIKADTCDPGLIERQIKTYYPGAKAI